MTVQDTDHINDHTEYDTNSHCLGSAAGPGQEPGGRVPAEGEGPDRPPGLQRGRQHCPGGGGLRAGRRPHTQVRRRSIH